MPVIEVNLEDFRELLHKAFVKTECIILQIDKTKERVFFHALLYLINYLFWIPETDISPLAFIELLI